MPPFNFRFFLLTITKQRDLGAGGALLIVCEVEGFRNPNERETELSVRVAVRRDSGQT